MRNKKDKKDTKRALISSMTALILCCAMLVGTTFAWFTDSVTSGKNKIVAGNLDVELYAKDSAGGDYTPVTVDSNLFREDALWEPGHVEYINLKVANLGTLALKYQLSVNIASEKGSINATGEEFKLSNYIRFAVVDGEQTYEGNTAREDAIAAAEAADSTTISALNVNDTGVLYPESKRTDATPSEEYVTLVVYMPTTVGNEANYRTGENAPEITLGVNLVATQTPYESDSFDENYDEKAVMPVMSAKEFTSGVNKNNAYVILGNDMMLTQTITINRAGGTAAIDLNGKTLTTDFSGTSDVAKSSAIYYGILTGTLNLTGDGTIAASAGNYAVTAWRGTVNISGGTYIGDVTAVYARNQGKINISGGFFEVLHDAGNTEQCKFTINKKDSDTSAKITITGGTFVNFNPEDNQAEGAGTNFVADGYKVISENQSNGDIWYTVVPE